MSHILYAWEFGAGLGHIGPFLPLARGLRARGHDVHWVVAQVDQAARLLDQDGFTWLQAPHCPEAASETPPLNYADILLRFGYAQQNTLLGLVVAWRQILKLVQPTLLIADHAPTAILAARTLGLPIMLFGNGFVTPPPVSPFPNMRPWVDIPIERLLAIETQVIQQINGLLHHFNQPPLTHLYELFQVDETALLTFPELDHYPQRGPASYWGALPAAIKTTAYTWPTTPQCPRIYAYLRASAKHCNAALQALQALSCPCLIYCPDASDDLKKHYASDWMQFSNDPVDLRQMAQDVDVALTYASTATTIAFLLAGKPLLMLPGHLEQFILAKCVEQCGAGLLIHPEQPVDDLPQKLQRLLNDPFFRDNARAFAKKYAGFNQDQVQTRLVHRIEELASRKDTS